MWNPQNVVVPTFTLCDAMAWWPSFLFSPWGVWLHAKERLVQAARSNACLLPACARPLPRSCKANGWHSIALVSPSCSATPLEGCGTPRVYLTAGLSFSRFSPLTAHKRTETKPTTPSTVPPRTSHAPIYIELLPVRLWSWGEGGIGGSYKPRRLCRMPSQSRHPLHH